MKIKLLFLFLLVIVSSCVYKPDQVKSKLIVCSTGIIGDLVKQLLGSEYQVKILMGPGVDPHNYEAKPSDVRALGEAKVIIFSGLHLEGKMAGLMHKMKEEKNVIEFSDGMDKSSLIALTSQTYDPHVWFDVNLWMQGLKYCKSKLVSTFPEDSAQIEKRFLKLLSEGKKLDKYCKEEIAKIPGQKRVLITSHDAFHYFGKAYGVKVKAIQGVSTVTEPGLKNVRNLVDYIVENQIPSVFIESSVSRKSIDALIEACEAKGHRLKIGGMMYSDALGGKNSNANTYFKMIKKNMITYSKSMN